MPPLGLEPRPPHPEFGQVRDIRVTNQYTGQLLGELARDYQPREHPEQQEDRTYRFGPSPMF